MEISGGWRFLHIQAAAPGAQARGRKWSSSVEELLEGIWQLGKTMSCQKTKKEEV